MMVSRRFWLAGLVVGTALRVVTLPWPGTGDVRVWKIWSYAASQHGVLQMYGVGGTPTERRVHEFDGLFATVDYPPLSLAELAAAGRIYQAVTDGYANTTALTSAIKTLPLLADVGITWLLAWAVRRVAPQRPEASRLVALAYWLNPAVLMNGAVLGHLDPLVGLPVMAALVAAAFGRSWLAGACVALGLLTKPQAVLMGPLVALAVFNTAPQGRGWRAVLSAGVASSLVLAAAIVPLAAVGAWPNFLQSMQSLGRHDQLSANTANPWWIITYVMRAAYAVGGLGWHDAFTLPVRRPLAITRIVELGYPNPRIGATLLVMAAIAWGLWKCRTVRDLGGLAALGGWIVFAYFMLGIAVHENHSYMLVPMVVLAAVLRQGWWPLALALSMTMALNLNLFYGLGDGIGYAIPRGITVPDLSVWLAVLNVALFVAYARRLARTATAAA
jgi:hypothetical protein